MRVFHLWLSTKVTSPTNNLVVPLTSITSTSLNSVSWQVDWDSLFRGWNKKYRRCNVKFQLNSESFTASAGDWENYQGVLTCNLASDAGSSTNFGTALGLYYPIDCPTTGTTTHCFTLNTLSNQQGVDLIVPQSNQIFTISWLRNSANLGINTLALVDYEVLFQFELSEPFDEKS